VAVILITFSFGLAIGGLYGHDESFGDHLLGAYRRRQRSSGHPLTAVEVRSTRPCESKAWTAT
jgi:hypothetical protein